MQSLWPWPPTTGGCLASQGPKGFRAQGLISEPAPKQRSVGCNAGSHEPQADGLMRLDRSFFELQAAFVRRAAEILDISQTDAFRSFTTFYWIADDNDAGRRPEEWSFDPAHPAWSAFSNAIQNGTDPVDYVYRPWGAFNRPPRWPWHPHHGTVVTYSSPDGVVHAPPSLALTLRQATCQRLDWRLCRGLRSLPRAAGPALCCPPPAD